MFRQMLKNYNLFRIGTSSELKPHINLKKRIVTAVTNSAGTVYARAKKLVKSNKKKFIREIAFLAVFPVQKLIFCRF